MSCIQSIELLIIMIKELLVHSWFSSIHIDNLLMIHSDWRLFQNFIKHQVLFTFAQFSVKFHNHSHQFLKITNHWELFEFYLLKLRIILLIQDLLKKLVPIYLQIVFVLQINAWDESFLQNINCKFELLGKRDIKT